MDSTFNLFNAANKVYQFQGTMSNIIWIKTGDFPYFTGKRQKYFRFKLKFQFIEGAREKITDFGALSAPFIPLIFHLIQSVRGLFRIVKSHL